ncbi:hypothetical protein TRICI_002512 [Trichomonascus ciferrii]|uniref:asparagine--tRNA ligase n=1 Tax=Trichomonascus ciferrii TaxID=44093 RepID=A0A642V5N6_9ASCO|nr:hypothetical protein TRICI_002512 [Trichomonascus ciferrii]
MKRVAFADVSDGTSERSLMVVMKPDESRDLSTGACVEISGLLKPSQGAKQDLELEAQKIKTLGAASADYPLQKKYHTPEFLRSIPQFRWKSTRNSSVLRYRSYAHEQLSKYFSENLFTHVQSPVITSSDCEGAGEVFQVRAQDSPDFFGKPAYLTVSSQLHLEVYAAALSRVWNMTPAFRAEESDTNRHLSEFWMVEAELAFTKSLHDVTSVAEAMIRGILPRGLIATDIIASIRDPERQEMVQKRWEMIENSDHEWPRITYTEAVETLQREATHLRKLEWGDDLGSEHEKYLAGNVFRGPVFITDYPVDLKPFYMKRSVGTEKTAACFDLLVPEFGELIGGSLREDDYDVLMANMEKLGMDATDMGWYTDLRKYGSFPHGGYGMGFERWVCYACGVDNIRDAIGFPRWAGSCSC